MKRICDLVIAACAIVLLSPIILTISILIRLKIGKEIFFKQQRPGLHGKPFFVYKFRTMTNQRDANGDLLPDELRLTDFGKAVRKLSLDELPQLINVLKGEMSLVGPRPLAMEYLPLYSHFQARRHEAKPGITGWAQVNGRNTITWEEKFRLDVWYVDNQTVFLDLKILFLTIKKVITTEGISQSGHATMPDFVGNPYTTNDNLKHERERFF